MGIILYHYPRARIFPFYAISNTIHRLSTKSFESIISDFLAKIFPRYLVHPSLLGSTWSSSFGTLYSRWQQLEQLDICKRGWWILGRRPRASVRSHLRVTRLGNWLSFCADLCLENHARLRLTRRLRYLQFETTFKSCET